MDERTGLGRGKVRAFALLGLESVLHKEGEAAGIELVHARGGQVQALAVQSLDDLPIVQRAACRRPAMRTADKFGICAVVQRSAGCRGAVVSKGSACKLGRRTRRFERVGVRVGGLDGQSVQSGAECTD